MHQADSTIFKEEIQFRLPIRFGNILRKPIHFFPFNGILVGFYIAAGHSKVLVITNSYLMVLYTMYLFKINCVTHEVRIHTSSPGTNNTHRKKLIKHIQVKHNFMSYTFLCYKVRCGISYQQVAAQASQGSECVL